MIRDPPGRRYNCLERELLRDKMADMGFLSKTNSDATPKRLAISSLVVGCFFALWAWWINRDPQAQIKMPVWQYFWGGAFTGWIVEWHGVPYCGARRKAKPKDAESRTKSETK